MSTSKKGLLRHFDQFLQNERLCIIDEELNIKTLSSTPHIESDYISKIKARYFKLVELRHNLENILK